MPALHLEPWLTRRLALVFLVELARLSHLPGRRPTPPATKHPFHGGRQDPVHGPSADP